MHYKKVLSADKRNLRSPITDWDMLVLAWKWEKIVGGSSDMACYMALAIGYVVRLHHTDYHYTSLQIKGQRNDHP